MRLTAITFPQTAFCDGQSVRSTGRLSSRIHYTADHAVCRIKNSYDDIGEQSATKLAKFPANERNRDPTDAEKLPWAVCPSQVAVSTLINEGRRPQDWNSALPDSRTAMAWLLTAHVLAHLRVSSVGCGLSLTNVWHYRLYRRPKQYSPYLRWHQLLPAWVRSCSSHLMEKAELPPRNLV